MSDEVLTKAPQEQSLADLLDEPGENETPPDPSPEEKQEEDTAASPAEAKEKDGDIPFHEHPRWKEVYSKAKRVDELQSELDELRSAQEETRQKFTTLESSANDAKIPEWFSDLYGDNQQAWGKYSAYEHQRTQSLREEIVRENEGKQHAAVAERQYYEQLNDREIASIKEEGHDFDDNKLRKFAMSYYEEYGSIPTKTDGTVDFRKTLALMDRLSPTDDSKSKARKKIAAGTTSSSNEASAEPADEETMTPAKIRKFGGWRGRFSA